jgi:peptidyl-prolyl cis-trans isomerase SurA
MNKLIGLGFLLILPFMLNAQSCFQDMHLDRGEDIERLKLAEAKAQRLDTTLSFRSEMQRFRSEILKDMEAGTGDPEFSRLMKEYEKGLLLYEITNREVFMKSYTDTAGLRRFYEERREYYQWKEPHFRGFVVHAKTRSDRERLQMEIDGLPIDSAATYLKKNYIMEDTALVKIGNRKVFAPGDDEYVDELIFHMGKGVPYLEFPRYFVVGELLEQPQDYTDVLTDLMDDYQKYLECIWIEELRKAELRVKS